MCKFFFLKKEKEDVLFNSYFKCEIKKKMICIHMGTIIPQKQMKRFQGKDIEKKYGGMHMCTYMHV